MTAPFVGDDAIAVVEEEQHLSVPIIGRQRPAMAEDYGLSASPILLINLGAFFGCDRWWYFSFQLVGRCRSICRLGLLSHCLRRQVCGGKRRHWYPDYCLAHARKSCLVAFPGDNPVQHKKAGLRKVINPSATRLFSVQEAQGFPLPLRKGFGFIGNFGQVFIGKSVFFFLIITQCQYVNLAKY